MGERGEGRGWKKGEKIKGDVEGGEEEEREGRGGVVGREGKKWGEGEETEEKGREREVEGREKGKRVRNLFTHTGYYKLCMNCEGHTSWDFGDWATKPPPWMWKIRPLDGGAGCFLLDWERCWGEVRHHS